KFQTSWQKLLGATTLIHCGFFSNVLIPVRFDQAKSSFKQCARYMALLHHKINSVTPQKSVASAFYFYNIVPQNTTRVFTRCDVLPSIFLKEGSILSLMYQKSCGFIC
ncbi:hypothetical protein E2320_004240, partial [Naja naja]